MTIYQTMLGDDFHRLHPMLKHRYALPEGQSFVATGVMKKIEAGTKLLNPFYALASKFDFLFPESGENIPFTICNTTIPHEKSDYAVLWERTFYFKEKTRHFNAVMTIDLVSGVVQDYLGSPALFYSDLTFHVTKEGRLLIRSGVQRFVLGCMELPIPKPLEGRVIVEEGYDDLKGVFTIHVSIHNPIVGRLMMYAGEFKEILR